MGMLLQYHRQAAVAPAPRAKRQRNRRKAKAQDTAPEPTGSDEQVAETFDADPEASTDE